MKNAEDALVNSNVKNPYIKISTLTKDGEYTLEVSDNAGGIAKEQYKSNF
ncbi:MAG: hypothetical protein L3J10_03565 [Sulfurimonas sp.]|nr:hypothetical protein [Sulfurimonas sp.]